MKKHGGKRIGAGRPPIPEEEKKIPMTIKVAPIIRRYLRQRQATETIETAITRSKDFKQWKNENEIS